MQEGRRRFLTVAGLSVLAAGGAPALSALVRDAHATGPGHKPGHKRWGMLVDLRKCFREQGCTLCVDACHKAHNVPNLGNAKEEVKWIWKEGFEQAFPTEENHYLPEALHANPLPVFCNHCDEPPCVRVCPTKATWRREDGIVMMDWHRCIGCRYCMVACPYGSRSFNWRNPRPFIPSITSEFPTRMKGVVEKCTLCEERLAKGQLPACVEACKAHALVFGDLGDPASEIRALLRTTYTLRRKASLGTQPEVYYSFTV
jgi:molybdopterin-containing oxidoreductase family iron-sulfur binding subunit